MIKNISFVFQKIRQKHRGLLCYLILCVLSSLGISVVAVWFPAFVVSRISTGKADAAQLAAAMNEQLGDMHTLMADGAFDEIHAWLSQRIYRYGSLYSSRELIENACGRPLSSDDYMDYLRNKFSEVYRLH